MLRPPNTNGIMELTEKEQMEIKAKLGIIKSNFVKTDDKPFCDTFYITATYNRENPDMPINGDTCEMLLAEDQPQSEVE
jgi:hypothetical protein